jgi:alpha-glucan,water dikinase
MREALGWGVLVLLLSLHPFRAPPAHRPPLKKNTLPPPINKNNSNHIPELKGTWMEEWHQKLHNNTTPDDVPICQAYLAFLEADGDASAYWRVLSDAGVTRERLESFERPVRCEPEWFGPDKKSALVRDFRAYLGILKAVHSGADLQSAAAAVASTSLPEAARPHLGYVLSHIGDAQVLPFVEAAVEARAELAAAEGGRRLAQDRDLLYLDLALEGAVRAAAERGIGGGGDGGGGKAAALMAPLLQNLALSLGDNEEVAYCLKAWQALPTAVRLGGGGRASRDEALLAVAVASRVRRAVAAASDSVVARVSRFSSSLGRAAGCDAWAVDVFAEEVVRGGPLFAVSLALSAVEPGLRAAAELGAWQVISPGDATGRLVHVPGGLSDVQDLVYDEPTVLVVGEVTGEEEVPEGAVAVLTPDAPDVLSHVAVRARNLRVLFATCHDSAPLDELRAAQGSRVHVKTTAAGAVTWSAVAEGGGAAGGPGAAADNNNGSGSSSDGRAPQLSIGEAPKWCGKWALTMDQFLDGVVGAKSKNLAAMRELSREGGPLPADVAAFPPAVTVPFGAFEQALQEPANKAVAAELREAVERVRQLEAAKAGSNHVSAGSSGSGGSMSSSTLSDSEGGTSSNGNGASQTPTASLSSVPAALARCRELAMRVAVPPDLRAELAAALTSSGIPPPENEERWMLAEQALKGVWASKYTERAFLSLRRRGIDFDKHVRMAVCVMRVVPARYAFVLHTTNPSTGDKGEIFGELVKGLGEALVSGAVPGSSLAFAARKPEGGGGAAADGGTLDDPSVLSYPSKSVGMFVRESLIFRSDSNGEDLEGYAGAGLYESLTMDREEIQTVDYSSDPLTADVAFRRDVLSRVAKAGWALEKALGGAQDVEGVVDPEGQVYIVQTRPQV